MMARRPVRNKLKVRKSISLEPMLLSDMEMAESIMAKMVARAFAADHPELFGRQLDQVLDIKSSRSSPAVRTEAVAPAANGGGLEEEWSMEQYGINAKRQI